MMAAVAAWHRSDSEEIPHIQGQRSSSKLVGTGAVAVAVRCLSDCEEIPLIQEQRTSPSYIVGGTKLHLESNPTPTRNTQRAQTNLCARGPRDPTETETELCLSAFCGGTGQQWTAAGAGALGAAALGMV